MPRYANKVDIFFPSGAIWAMSGAGGVWWWPPEA